MEFTSEYEKGDVDKDTSETKLAMINDRSWLITLKLGEKYLGVHSTLLSGLLTSV